MSQTLGDRLKAARHARFVGREAERALFEDALSDDSLPFHVLHVFGPGGSGKTTLLSEYDRHCKELGIHVAYVDGRYMAATPEAFQRAISDAKGDSSRGGRSVLLVDTYESVDALDGWLRRWFLPTMDEDLLVVLAGRNRPDSAWTSDSGWREEVRVLPLRNLTPEESTDFLFAREVPEEQHEAVRAFTHGHPLALALAAEHVRQAPESPFTLDDAPDVVRTLLQRFVLEAPGKAHRSALEAASLVRALTETILAVLLETDDAYEAFEWLRGLAFMQEGPNGIFPHDVVRDVLVADLQWRDAVRFDELHRRARRHCMDRLRDATTDEQRREIIGAYVFLYRTNPIVRPMLGTLRDKWEEVGKRMVDSMTDEDIPVLIEMVAKHEGDESAEHAAFWFERQPENAQVFRDEEGLAVGLLLTLRLDTIADDERSVDPAVEASLKYLENNAPLREGEQAISFRFWMDAEAHQELSAVQSLVFSNMVRRYLTMPKLAFSFLPCVDEEFWSTIFAFARVHRLPEADYVLDGHSYAVFGHDWRAEPVEMWMEKLAGQAPSVVPNQDGPSAIPTLLVLSKPDFAEAVHNALRGYAQPHTLETNPLLRSRLVEDRTGPKADSAERVATLVDLLAEAATLMENAPKETNHFRAVQATYLKPAPSQAIAAERLDVPFSTYRRHLKRGIENIVEVLWRMEIA